MGEEGNCQYEQKTCMQFFLDLTSNHGDLRNCKFNFEHKLQGLKAIVDLNLNKKYECGAKCRFDF